MTVATLGASAAPAEAAARVLGLTTRQPQRALALARRALRECGLRNAGGRALLLRALGHALRAVGDYREARTAYRKARRLFARAGRELEHAVCALGLVDACMYLRRPTEALAAADDARRVFVRHRDALRLARLETNVGNLYHHVDDLEAALDHYRRAAQLFARSGTDIDRARVDHNRANILAHLGRRSEAERLYRQAGATLAAAGEPIQAAQARYGLACLSFLSGEYAKAIGELEDVRSELLRLRARPLLALADLDLAEALLAMRLYPESLALARSARRWFHRRRMRGERARCDLVAGTVLARQGRARASIRCLRGAGTEFRARGHRAGTAAVCLARSQVERRLGRPGRAVAFALRARAHFSRAGFRGRALAAGAIAAEALLDKRAHGQAAALARTLLREPRWVGDGYGRIRLHRVEGKACAGAGQIGAALEAYRQALAEADRVAGTMLVDEWWVGFLDEEPVLADEFLGVLLQRRPAPRPAEIWKWLRQARARPRRRQESTPDGRGLLLKRRVAALRAELKSCYGRMWRSQSGIGSRRVQTAGHSQLARRALVLEGHLRRLANIGAPAPSPRPRTTDPLAPGTTCLHYFSAGGRLGALRRDARGYSLFTDLAPGGDIERAARLFNYQVRTLGSHCPPLASHSGTILRRASAHLATIGRLVLDPVLDDGVAAQRLCVQPVGALHQIPFHALEWRGAPLAESRETIIDYYCEPADRTQAGGRSGAWVFGFGAADAPAVEFEALEVAEAIRRGEVHVERRIGRSARIVDIREAAERGALLHFCGHAVYRDEHPEFSALRMADGWIGARDFAELPLRGATVVLSACETGPRGNVGGGEMLGLARGLLRAGATAVVASLWPVDDAATRRLMVGLYREWSKGGSLGAALRSVQRRAWREDPTSLTWASFVAIGAPVVPWPGDRGGA